LNFQSLYEDLQRRLGEVVGTPAFWSVSELQGYINESLVDIHIDCDGEQYPIKLSTATFLSTSNTPVYTMASASNILIPKRIVYKNKTLFLTDEESLDREDANWRTAAVGTPKKYYWTDWDKVGLYPKPGTNSETASLIYVPYPTTMTTTTAIPDIPQVLHIALVYRGGLRALSKEGEGAELEKAITYFKTEYDAIVARWKLIQKLSGIVQQTRQQDSGYGAVYKRKRMMGK
jgi:hypothetical protein